MSVKAHYDNHLAHFYAWMSGDRQTRQQEFSAFLQRHEICPQHTANAIDFGAGHGLQSIPLAQTGFNVRAIDFNLQLLDELNQNKSDLPITTIPDDMRHVLKHADFNPELIVCCGDTLPHLESEEEVCSFLTDCYSILTKGGKLLLSFRDYTDALCGDARFIPVKSDDTRILTCFLEYKSDKVHVTDLCYEKEAGNWKQKVSSYTKTRLSPTTVSARLEQAGIIIRFSETVRGMVWILGEKAA
ncbi:MAG: class I SAM-dependent methyltransferase [Bacteroidetes bacterium]|nr:class I SAM-dependent methyltransferase [Bacteroidota bacterium]